MTTSSRTTTAKRRIAAGVLAGVAALSLAGCAGGSRSGSDQPGVDNTETAAPNQPVKTSISTSSEKDLAAALRTNGVDDPENWAQILVQNKPYPAGAEGTQKIQQVLQQFQASPDLSAKITNVVEP
ncbi:hypothetical protein LWC35_06825 [Pseudonocardia kujensis]|uniref:hypothetical protein n=1 Tax=Pseudonocardia kujensis TaxID=1128675 RepID=UPI001E541E84|nr:hypothetical protein [Pseudonocardia kujensis]MCE0762621.1 hypothetical protein [Pseudonocardia kujensis]